MNDEVSMDGTSVREIEGTTPEDSSGANGPGADETEAAASSPGDAGAAIPVPPEAEPPKAECPRPIEQLRALGAAGLAGCSPEELALIDADCGDPDAEKREMGAEIERATVELREFVRAEEKRIGDRREAMTLAIPAWQARLARKHAVVMELARRADAEKRAEEHRAERELSERRAASVKAANQAAADRIRYPLGKPPEEKP